MNTEHKSNTASEIKDLWQTPKFVFDYYDKRFGFNLDMAASRENALCDEYCTESDDALLHDTLQDKLNNLARDGNIPSDRVSIFCNPPYSSLMPWVAMMVEYAETYGVKIVTIIPADTSVKWFKYAFDHCTECHFISGRLSFINAETQKPVSGNNKGSVVFVFDPSSPVKKSVHLIDRDSMK
ncbi:DNA methyltransferase [Vibrio phage K24]|nr:N-6-adenine-methyltransferase [Vibrio phage 14E30.1]QZI92523.1 N-6-adenine-methyltransferase [Vibrio phage 14E30.2]